MNKWIKTLVILGAGYFFAGTALANSDDYNQKVMEITKPVSQVCVEGEACSKPKTAPAASSVPAPAPVASARTGKQIFGSVCAACHSTGALGAPKVGNKAMWAPRIAKGVDTLLQHAMNGFNAMPPKGTCSDCSKAEIKSTIEYMISKSK